MRVPEPILTAHLFAPVHDALMDLLRGLGEREWSAPTAAGEWTVKDVAAHLLDTGLRRLSAHRDAYAAPLPPDAFDGGIGPFVNALNRRGVDYFRTHSPAMLIDMHGVYGPQLTAFFTALDPMAPAQWGVSWAGEDSSPTWFDVARELTERWHHQQQIRDATGRPPLYDFLGPVLATFVRAMPFTYRETAAPEGTAVVLKVTGEGEGTWSLVRTDGAWTLFDGAHEDPATTVSMRGDKAWRVFTRQRVDDAATVAGEPRYAEPLLHMVSIV